MRNRKRAELAWRKRLGQRRNQLAEGETTDEEETRAALRLWKPKPSPAYEDLVKRRAFAEHEEEPV